MFEAFLKKGLLKAAPSNRRQIENQLRRARKDTATALTTLAQDPEWAATIAYQAMLRAGRALLFSKGYLPSGGGQHKTVVEITGEILGKGSELLISKFEKMRRDRNFFFYESGGTVTETEARSAIQAAQKLIRKIQSTIFQSGDDR